MNIEISVVIATFNASATIQKCLDSIIPQLTSETELIVIDGGSHDSTLEIIRSFKKYISYTISERDGGIYDAWNKGIKAAQGNWIAFIGADDILMPDALKIYLNYIKSTPRIGEYDYICAHNEYIDENGRVMKLLGIEPKWSNMRRFMAAAHVGSLHSKRNLFDIVGLYDFENFHICADYELLMRKKNKLRYLMIPDVIARMQIGGMSFSLRAVKETYLIRKTHHSVSRWYNLILFLKDYLLFVTYRIRR